MNKLEQLRAEKNTAWDAYSQAIDLANAERDQVDAKLAASRDNWSNACIAESTELKRLAELGLAVEASK